MTLGEALLYAKQQYVADLGSVGPFEQKAVNALTFYGLPMRQIGTPGGPVAPPQPPATTTDPITGLQSLPINSLVTFGAPLTAANGFYFTGLDGVDATNGRPYEPRKIVRDITQPERSRTTSCSPASVSMRPTRTSRPRAAARSRLRGPHAAALEPGRLAVERLTDRFLPLADWAAPAARPDPRPVPE
jgi:hypothetical protein